MSLLFKVNLKKKLNFLSRSFVRKIVKIPLFITEDLCSKSENFFRDTVAFLRKRKSLMKTSKSSTNNKILVFEKLNSGKLNYSYYEKIKQEIITFTKKC